MYKYLLDFISRRGKTETKENGTGTEDISVFL
jgi:hypothetical protein